MKVNINNIEKSLNKLKEEIKNLENIFLNIYANYKNLSSAWIDGNSVVFFNDVNTNRIIIMNSIIELEDIYKIFSFIVNTYKKYGKKVEVDFGNFSKLDSKYRNIIKQMEEVIHKYNNLEVQNSAKEKEILHREKRKIEKSKSNIENIRHELNELYKLAKDSEANVNSKLSHISILRLKNTAHSTSSNLKISARMNLMAFTEYKNSLNRNITKCTVIIEKINDLLADMIKNYSSKNSDYLEDICNEFKRKMTKSLGMFNDDVNYLKMQESKYFNTSKSVKNKFEKLGE